MDDPTVLRECYYNMVNDGGALIKILKGYYVDLYEIPLYGGEPVFIQKCETLKEAQTIADSWT